MSESAAAVATPASTNTGAESTGESLDTAIDRAQGTQPKAMPKYGKYGEPLRSDEEMRTKEAAAIPDPKSKVGSEKEEPTPEQPLNKKTITVDGKEVELDDDALRRFAQKGAAADKRMFQLSQEKKQIQQMAQNAEQMQAKAIQFLELLEKNPIQALLMVNNGDMNKVRAVTEPFLAERIREELEDEQNPYAKALREERQRREAAETKWQQHERQQQELAQNTQKQGLINEYTQQIIGVLESAGLPKTDKMVAKMAEHMHRLEKRNVKYTNEQLANLVREDYTDDIGHFAGGYAKAIEEAHSRNDIKAILNIGEQLEGILGKPTAMALRRYDLAKLRSGQPTTPKPVTETSRVAQMKKQEPKRHYMSEEEYAAERKRRAQAIDRGESVGDW